MPEFKININGNERIYLIYVTSAPEEYDGFGTITVKKSPLGKKRYILIHEKHLDWQINRYLSGRHLAEECDLDNIERFIAEHIWNKILKGESEKESE